MKEPVILPTSRVTIDLATIKSHLLSVPTDPFNRAPLKIEDVIPSTSPSYKKLMLDVALKAEIEAFKKEKRGKKANNA
jgi:ubiquitin conjugation factor E4 B